MNADVLTTRLADGIAVITLGSARRIYFDEEMGDALTEALDGFAGDASVRIVVGIAILIVYYQVLNFGKDMAENGRVSSFVALWIPFLIFSLGSMYMFYVANSRLNQDPFAVVFGSIDDLWRWLKRRSAALFRRRRPA